MVIKNWVGGVGGAGRGEGGKQGGQLYGLAENGE